jgi:DNA-binding beta-propeller fold protein YncE
LSPDGKVLYAVAEIVKPGFADRLPGHDVKALRHDGCEQGGGRSMPNGMLFAFDTAKTAAMPAGAAMPEIRGSLAGWTDAGCSPVRVAVSADGSLVYVTSRGDDKVLVFDAAKIGRVDGNALVAAISSGGEAPVGLTLFNGGKSLLVADSNRFSGGSGNAVVIDVSNPKEAKVVQKIKTGEFPRNITASPDGKTLYMTIFLSDELMVLKAAE